MLMRPVHGDRVGEQGDRHTASTASPPPPLALPRIVLALAATDRRRGARAGVARGGESVRAIGARIVCERKGDGGGWKARGAE
jgi:hypothetical protein